MINSKFMPVSDYAKLHKITVQAVYKRIKSNRLLSKKIGNYILVSENNK